MEPKVGHVPVATVVGRGPEGGCESRCFTCDYTFHGGHIELLQWQVHLQISLLREIR